MQDFDPHSAEKNHFSTSLESVSIESVQITLDLYKSGKSGVPIHTLWKFAHPILDHYQLNLTSTPHTDVTTANLDDMTLILDILETASMIWDHCSLSGEDRASSLEVLTLNLLGHDTDPSENEQFLQLLQTMESLWTSLVSDSIAMDPSPEALATPSFGEPTSTPDLEQHISYGPNQLDMPEAFALFSRPLIEDEAFQLDPSHLEEAMTRAQAYWDLAHAPRDEFELHLQAVIAHLGSTSPRTVKAEARLMMDRFDALFPERKQ